nr:immunoglobulin light chain junction region [Macaca mulatta]
DYYCAMWHSSTFHIF